MSTMTISPSYAPRVARPRPVRGQVRLTRRGRLVVLVLALGLALAAGLALSDRSTATREGGTPPATEVVHVGAGETLWGIASELADNGDVRAMVDQIEQLNALDSSMLYAGQELHVPVAD